MNILLVDDEPKLLDSLVIALQSTGYDIITETNPLKALEMYKRHLYNVVITDVRMPEMSGIELLKEIKDFHKNANVIIMTAYGDLETATKAINAKAYAFFGKPIEIKDLIKTLKEIEYEIENGLTQKIAHHTLKIEYDRLNKTYKLLLEQIEKLEKIKNGRR